MNRGGPTRNDGGRYSTPRGRGRGRSPSRSAGSSSAHHNGPAGPVGPSSNVSSGNKNRGSVWRPRVPVGSIPKELDSSTSKSPCRENCSFLDTKDDVSSDLGSIPKQLDSISTSKCPCRENCSFPDTKDDVSSDLGKLKPGENSPEAVTPKTEQVYCMSVSVIPEQLDSISTSKSPCRENCSFPDTKDDVSSDLGKLKLGENFPEAVTPKTEQVYCMSVSVISSASAFKKGFPSLDSDKDLSLQRTQKGKVPDAEVEGDSSLRVNRLPALDTVHMGNEQTPHKKAVDSGRSDISDSVSLGVPYDICPVRAGNFVTLKAPLHVQNRTKRNEAKRSVEGKRINVLRSGMILLKSYISFNDQIEIVNKCRDLGLSSGGFYEPGYREGGKLHLKMMCLGKNWDPERSEYGDQRPSDGAKPPSIPYEFCQLVKGAIQASHSFLRERHKVPIVEHVLPTVSPTICIVNFYSKSGRLGLHQDKDESQESLNRGLPVVSFSIGDSAEFLYNDHRDTESAKKIILESGDVLIFGGESRRVFHGVTTISPETAPTALLDETNLRPGRLNLTFREY